MKLEVGKTYRDRDGEHVKILHEAISSIYPFVGANRESYADNGRLHKDTITMQDLIEEVVVDNRAANSPDTPNVTIPLDWSVQGVHMQTDIVAPIGTYVPKEKVKKTRIQFVNVYPDGVSGLYLSLEYAKESSRSDVIATVPVTIEWEEEEV